LAGVFAVKRSFRELISMHGVFCCDEVGKPPTQDISKRSTLEGLSLFDLFLPSRGIFQGAFVAVLVQIVIIFQKTLRLCD